MAKAATPETRDPEPHSLLPFRFSFDSRELASLKSSQGSLPHPPSGTSLSQLGHFQLEFQWHESLLLS